MFTILRTYLGVDYPVPTLPVDSLGTPYTFADITIHSTGGSEEVLDIYGVAANITFDGDAFPLDGADYTTAATGDLIVTVTQSLAQGLYRFPFVTQRNVYPLTGWSLHGHLAMGIQSVIHQKMLTALLVQSFSVPGVTLPATGGSVTVPTVTP